MGITNSSPTSSASTMDNTTTTPVIDLSGDDEMYDAAPPQPPSPRKVRDDGRQKLDKMVYDKVSSAFTRPETPRDLFSSMPSRNGQGRDNYSNNSSSRRMSEIPIKVEGTGEGAYEYFPSIEDDGYSSGYHGNATPYANSLSHSHAHSSNNHSSKKSKNPYSRYAFGPTHLRASPHLDTMDNERTPVRSNYQSPQADNGMFVSDDYSMMDDTPSRGSKKRRTESGYQQSNGYAPVGYVPAAAPMTPSAPLMTPSSSSRRATSTFGTQARSQKNGARALSFAPPIQQEDLEKLFAELHGVIGGYHDATAKVLAVYKEFEGLKTKMEKQIAAIEEHVDKSLQKLVKGQKEALKEVSDKQTHLEDLLGEFALENDLKQPGRGGAFGGSALGQRKEESVFAGMINGQAQRRASQQASPSAPQGAFGRASQAPQASPTSLFVPQGSPSRGT